MIGISERRRRLRIVFAQELQAGCHVGAEDICEISVNAKPIPAVTPPRGSAPETQVRAVRSTLCDAAFDASKPNGPLMTQINASRRRMIEMPTRLLCRTAPRFVLTLNSPLAAFSRSAVVAGVALACLVAAWVTS